jgi:hypothetical protein
MAVKQAVLLSIALPQSIASVSDVAEYACFVGLSETFQGIAPLLSNQPNKIWLIEIHLFCGFLDFQCIFIACAFFKVVGMH